MEEGVINKYIIVKYYVRNIFVLNVIRYEVL